VSEPAFGLGRLPSRQNTVRAVLVPVALFVLAGVLWAEPWRFVSPVPPATMAGFTYHCSDCHRLFPSPPETTRSLTWHRDIELHHGINDRCFNCHNRTNRDTFIDDWSREIPYDQPQLVCGKCHGPVYRDWLHGSHGRTNGYWDTQKGPQERRKCIECHDPHVPPFPPMRPAPGPHTLRMGDQHFPPEHVKITSPLRIYRQPEAGPGAVGPGQPVPPDERNVGEHRP
jgi:hypothetical protein